MAVDYRDVNAMSQLDAFPYKRHNSQESQGKDIVVRPNSTRSKGLMEAVLGNLEFVGCYLDDLIVFSKTIEEHKRHLEQVFDILDRENLRLNEEKRQFGVTALEYLGLNVDGGKRAITTTNKEKIVPFPRPRNQRQAKTFICLASYYRDLIHNFAYLAKPIQDTGNVKFQWREEQEAAFEQSRRRSDDSGARGEEVHCHHGRVRYDHGRCFKT
ncbi:UNVERIFIED_CONTAM: hypothetical protein PYX00_006916 [Menopon gallinae]|uniref:Reverse transcriptase domain-containing protein n=1 Tax=Menopon gallinae TaxID=328185 RepID=A0AAW2HHB7_9NEOP